MLAGACWAAWMAGPRPAEASATDAPAAGTGAPHGTLIVHASVIDGTGAPRRPAAVRIASGRIAEVGDLTPRPGEEVIDAGGQILAPGFIDTHSHADGEIFDHLDATAAVSQGITTVVVGQDGESPWPLATFFGRLEKTPPAVNVAAYAGHGTLRSRILGEDFRRVATAHEVHRMQHLLEKEMRAGAIGLSSGLEYDPGIYSDTSELVALARTAAAHGGRYISHVRSEDRHFWNAIDEIIAIGREARLPVQVSHTKLAMRSLWGQADQLLARLEAARAEGIDITGDIYPYLYWQSTLTVLFPARDFTDLKEAEFAVHEVSSPEGLLVTQFDAQPEYAGRTLLDISGMRQTSPAQTLMDLIALSEARRKLTGDGGESVIGTSMTEPDLDKLMAWPRMNFCTDGGLAGEHPRGYGSYPRVLGRYIRERGVLTLEEGIRKMTALAAEHMGLADRGTIRPGMAADLVLFDSRTVLDRATTENPHAVSDGILRVMVAGETVYRDGRATDKRPGRVLRRAAPAATPPAAAAQGTADS